MANCASRHSHKNASHKQTQGSEQSQQVHIFLPPQKHSVSWQKTTKNLKPTKLQKGGAAVAGCHPTSAIVELEQ